MTHKWVRSVSFNKKDPQDIARLQLIGKKSYSRFIKRLLDEEIKRQSLGVTATTKTATPPQTRREEPTTTSRTVVPQQQRGMQAKPRVFSNPMLSDRS